MNKLTNKILKAINEAISFALDDFNDEDLQGQIGSKVKYQGGWKDYMANKQITQKSFIYELLKRLPGKDKSIFKDFGFVNYKVTGNDDDWPYLVSLNQTMSVKVKDKIGSYFYNSKGWFNISWSALNAFLLYYSNKLFPNYRQTENKNDIEKLYDVYKYDLRGRDNDLINIIQNFIHFHPELKNLDLSIIDQISISPDNAFNVIIYELPKNDRWYAHVEIFSTENIVSDNGLNIDEVNIVRSKQLKFKRYLTKNICKRFDIDFPKILDVTSINNHVAYVYETLAVEDLHFGTRIQWRASEANRILRGYIPYNEVTENLRLFIWFTLSRQYYIEDNYHGSNLVYDELKYNDTKPYVVVSNETGEYLVAFYSIYLDYRKYKLIYAIIDNSDYSIMSKDFLKEIEYNEIELT